MFTTPFAFPAQKTPPAQTSATYAESDFPGPDHAGISRNHSAET